MPVLMVCQVEVILVPGAKRSTQDPQLEKLVRWSVLSVAAIVKAYQVKHGSSHGVAIGYGGLRQVIASRYELYFWSHLCHQFVTDIPLIAAERTTSVRRTQMIARLSFVDCKMSAITRRKTCDHLQFMVGNRAITCGLWHVFVRLSAFKRSFAITCVHRTDVARLPACS